MKVRKAIRTIAALGVGATMVGATMMGAMAADLSTYPTPFLKDGQMDSVLVIGKNAQPIDTIGMTNLAMGLQAAAVTKVQVCTTATSAAPTVSEGVKIDQSSTHFYVGTNMSYIKSSLDDSDLPEILGDVQYSESQGANKNNVEISQQLNFAGTTGVFGYFQDDDGAEEAGPYLMFDDAVKAYTYKLTFDTAVEYDGTSTADDLQSTVISMQGQKYTVTGVGTTGASPTKVLSKLTLMAGESTMWMTQDQSITKTVGGVDHTIMMIDVDADATSCGFNIDGSTVWIDVDDTETVGGLTLGVTDAKAVHTEKYDADICKVNFGASELILENGKEVKVEGKDVDGSNVVFGGATGSWTGLDIEWTPDEVTYLAEGDELVDPVFGNFKFVFSGVTRTDETIEVKAGASTGTIKFLNTAGKEIVIPLTKNAGLTLCKFGTKDEIDKELYLGTAGQNTCVGTTSVTDCEGATWLLNSVNEAHVIKLVDVDKANNKISFLDVTTNTATNDKVYVNDTAADIYISGIGNVNVLVGPGGIGNVTLLSPTAVTSIRTKNGAQLTALSDAANCTATFTEDKNAAGATTMALTVGYHAGDSELQIAGPTVSSLFGGAALDATEDDSDNKLYATQPWGTLVEYDSDNKDALTIKYPASKAQASVYVSPTGASLGSDAGTTAGCTVYDKVNKIPATATKFDSEIANPTAQNLISIGGPCVNSVTAALMGNPVVCYEGFEQGKAIIKLYESGSKVALVVAGATGEDTLRACKIMQNFELYKFSGKQMEATTVSESGLSVKAVQ